MSKSKYSQNFNFWFLINVEVELVEGPRGEFSVIYEEDPPALLYSMAEKDRLPTNNEITSLLVRIYGMDTLKTKNDKGL